MRRSLFYLVLPFLAAGSLRALPDNTAYAGLLQDHVHAGAVDYDALKRDDRLDTYLASLAQTDPDALPSREAQLAFWINTYNAYTLKLVTTVYPVETIRVITALGQVGNEAIAKPWDISFVVVNGRNYTLEHVEHEIVRKQFQEPRIHFALVCAAHSCPQLRNEPYAADSLETQLTEQSRWFFQQRNQFNPKTHEAGLSPILQWFAGDFGGTENAVLTFSAQFVPAELARSLQNETAQWRVTYLPYNWHLNDKG